MSKNDGGPAFPLPAHEVIYGPGMANKRVDAEYGMSLRDYFAAKALQGMLSNPTLPEAFIGADKSIIVQEICAKAFDYADTMLKERVK